MQNTVSRAQAIIKCLKAVYRFGLSKCGRSSRFWTLATQFMDSEREAPGTILRVSTIWRPLWHSANSTNVCGSFFTCRNQCWSTWSQQMVSLDICNWRWWAWDCSSSCVLYLVCGVQMINLLMDYAELLLYATPHIWCTCSRLPVACQTYAAKYSYII